MLADLTSAVWGVRLLDPVLTAVVWALAGLAVAVLLARGRLRSTLIGCLSGAVVGAVLLVVVQWIVPLFGGPLSPATNVWTVAAFAALGLAVCSLPRAPWWRRGVAVLSVPLVLIAAGIGINADYGLAQTLGEVIGRTDIPPIALPAESPGSEPASWQPPSDMPAKGRVGSVNIPATLSGFPARPASVYLPPAALVANPPQLPFVLMMMGQPGTTDPIVIEGVLDAFAAEHRGLAPIVVVADQLTDPALDPACVDSAALGNAHTYLTQDVVNWARSSLNISTDRTQWTVAGFSNGGTCAALFGAQLPEVFGNVIDVAGEEYPGQDDEAATLAGVFAGDQSAYDAAHPITVLAAGSYPDSWGYFADDGADGIFTAAGHATQAAATAAGWQAQWHATAVQGHGGEMLGEALGSAFAALAPRLGLT